MVYLSQAAAGTLSAALSAPVDVVLVCGPPLIGPNLASLAARKLGARLVNVIYDVYPDIAAETGRLSNRQLIALARLAERRQYRLSDRTLVLSDGLKRIVTGRGADDARVAIVPLWIDTDEISPMPRENRWRTEQGISADRFVVLYAGTIGVVSGVTVVADAAARLREHPEILFLFVGEGEKYVELEQRCRQLNLENTRFVPFQPRERLREVQATADVAIVTLAPGRARTSVPSKVLGYMAAGRAVVASVDLDSDTANEIRESSCGVAVPPGDCAELAAAIIKLKEDSTLRDQLGSNGRAWCVEHHGKQAVLERYRQVLQDVATDQQ